jgi:hypothetical protein
MNRKQKRMEDLRAAKDAKMKKVAIGLTVVLAVVLAFEVPKMMHSGGSSAAPATTTTDATATGSPTTATPAPETTAPGTAAAAVVPVASSKLPNSDTQPTVGKSQLYSFDHFTGKDPFAQQVVDVTQGQPDQPGMDASGNPTTSSSNATAGTTAKVTHHNQPARVLAAAGAARISVNGQVQIVRAGANFPKANPLFRLVSVRKGVARIGIASGSYSSGARTVSLVAGRTLTLVDTASGVRYKLRLLA